MDVLPPLSPRPDRAALAPEMTRAPPVELDQFLSKADVRRITSLSPTTIQRKINAGEFPRPIPLTKTRVAWLASEVLAWMRARVAERQAEKAA